MGKQSRLGARTQRIKRARKSSQNPDRRQAPAQHSWPENEGVYTVPPQIGSEPEAPVYPSRPYRRGGVRPATGRGVCRRRGRPRSDLGSNVSPPPPPPKEGREAHRFITGIALLIMHRSPFFIFDSDGRCGLPCLRLGSEPVRTGCVAFEHAPALHE